MNPQQFPGQAGAPTPPGGPGPAQPAVPAQPAAAAPPGGKGKKKKQNKGGGKVPSRRSTKMWAAFALIGLAVTALVLLLPDPDADDADTTFVAVASRSIPAQAEVKFDWFEAREVDPETLSDGALSGDTAEGALEQLNLGEDAKVYARYPIASGAQVTLNALSYEAQLPAGSNELEQDERLVSISANVASSVAGVLRVGDHVDVVATGSWDLQNFGSLAGRFDGATNVVEDVEIVGITIDETLYSDIASSIVEQQQTGAEDVENPRSPEDLLPGEPVPGIYTVKVHRDLVNRLLAAHAHLDLALVYRGQDAAAGEFSPATVADILCLPPRELAAGEQLPDLCNGATLPEQPYNDGSAPSGPPPTTEATEAPADGEDVDGEAADDATAPEDGS